MINELIINFPLILLIVINKNLFKLKYKLDWKEMDNLKTNVKNKKYYYLIKIYGKNY